MACESCGVEFDRPPANLSSGSNYCSLRCKAQSQLVRIVVQCESCGIDVERRPSEIGARVYCSQMCRNVDPAWNRRVAIVESTCEHCGRSFERWHSAGQRFCTYGCWGRFRWKHGLVSTIMLSTSRARSRWLGRWKGANYGKLGGRPRGYTEAKVDEVLGIKARNPKLGVRPIALRVGLSKDQVHEILNAHL